MISGVFGKRVHFLELVYNIVSYDSIINKQYYLSTVVRILGSRVGLNGGSVGGIAICLQNQLNLVDTSVKGSGAAGKVVLVGSRRDRNLKADSVINLKRNTLNRADVGDAGKTRRSSVGNLAHQLTREVGSAGEGVGAVLVRRRTVGGVGLVDSIERSVDGLTGSSALADKVREKSVFIAEEINTVRSVEELLGEVANKVVLDEVLIGGNTATGCQDGGGRESAGVDGVQLEAGGPSIHVDVILDIRGVGVVDIERVGLELEDGLHVGQLHVVDSDGTDIKSSRGFTSEFTGDTKSKSLVKTSKGKIHHNCAL